MPDQPVGLPLIQAQVKPGGVVLHIYATPSGQLLGTYAGDTIPMAAYAAGHEFDAHVQQLAPGEDIRLVYYSGDTGERLPDDAPMCPHCGSLNIDRGTTGLDRCRTCGGLSRHGVALVHHELPSVYRYRPAVDLGDDPDGDIEGYDGR